MSESCTYNKFEFNPACIAGLPLFDTGAGLVGARAALAAAPHEPLPCLNSDNSTGDELERVNRLTPGHRKAVYALFLNIEHLIKRFGINRIGFATITATGKTGMDAKEFQRRWNSLLTHEWREHYPDGHIMIIERGKHGRLHGHLLVVMNGDIRTGFNHEAVKCRDYRSASAYLRSEWAHWRRTLPKYGFGPRVEIKPIQSNAEAISRYVSKYISKHVGQRLEKDRRARMVRYSRGIRCATQNFSFVSPRSWLWRRKVGLIAEKVGAPPYMAVRTPHLGVPWKTGLLGGLSAVFGRFWSHHLGDILMSFRLRSYPDIRTAQCDGWDCTGISDDACDISFESDGSCLEDLSPDDVMNRIRSHEDIDILDKLRSLVEGDEYAGEWPQDSRFSYSTPSTRWFSC